MSRLSGAFFLTPVKNYIKWCFIRYKYAKKYKKCSLIIEYQSYVHNTEFGNFNWVGIHCSVIETTIGDHTYIGDYSFVNYATIGKFCSIGPNVRIAPGMHPAKVFVSTHPSTYATHAYLVKSFVKKDKFKSYAPVKIGNDVWIGANCLIVDGVLIGDGAIIAANSVVTKNVEPYQIVGGVPAKFIKSRFTDTQIEKLLQLKWWDKGDEWIQNNIELFEDIDKLVSAYF